MNRRKTEFFAIPSLIKNEVWHYSNFYVQLAVIFCLFSFLFTLDASAELNSSKVKKVPVSPEEIYPAIHFQKYLQQNPILDHESKDQKQEISNHQRYPELKQYYIVSENKKLEEKSGSEKEEIKDNSSLSNGSDNQAPDEHNYNKSHHEQLWQ